MQAWFRRHKSKLFSLGSCLLLQGLTLVIGMSAMAPSLAAQTAPGAAFQFGVREDGIYQVSYEALAEAGLVGAMSSRRLQVSVMGAPIPIRLEDGGDGEFGPGDRFQFLGRHRPGLRGHYSQESRFNVYRLELNSDSPRRYAPINSLQTGTATQGAEVFHHLEENRVRVRFKPALDRAEQPDLWYWERLSTLDPEPAELQLPTLDPTLAPETTIRMAFRGWSTPRTATGLFDHKVEVLLADAVIATGQWNGQQSHVVTVVGLPQLPADGKLKVRVPERNGGESGNRVVDVSLLDWVEVTQPFSGRPHSRVAHLKSAEGAVVPLHPAADGEQLVLNDQGQAVLSAPGGSLALARGEAFMASLADLPAPDWIVSDRPSRLKATSQRADYLMISHSALIEWVEPLAQFHRSRGLTVQVIDVQDIYDEFHHGLVSPAAIRDFVQFAYRRWQGPAPRFVLLVGDASWDSNNETPDFRLYSDWTYKSQEKKRFISNRNTPYAQVRFRNLVPAWSVATYEGHAASDNGYVTIADDDIYPDLAIGRFPVVDPEEVKAIVDKTIAYARHTDVGPWRRRVLWITNESQRFQRVSDRLDASGATVGLAGSKIYPAPEEKDNADHQQRLTRALDAGQLIVHFLGHGGRYIWRTGPPDIRKNHDLFTLDHLQALQPSKRLPLVLSMTCYSAPFDHPTADSIGEKFLRLADRGAVAVFAASWRNNPTQQFSQALLSELTRPGVTIGEAISAAKRTSRNKVMVETYNLLGDPAIPLAYPSGTVRLTAAEKGRVAATLDGSTANGQAIIDWLDAAGNVLATEQTPVHSTEFAFEPQAGIDAGRVAAVRVYFWNAETGIDALGGLRF